MRPLAIILASLSAVCMASPLGASPWQQDRFMVGAWSANGAGAAFDSEYVALNNAGLDFLVNSDLVFRPQPATLLGRLNALRTAVDSFRMQLIVLDDAANFTGIHENASPIANWSTIQQAIGLYSGASLLGFNLSDEPRTLAEVDSVASLTRLVQGNYSTLAFVNLSPASILSAFVRVTPATDEEKTIDSYQNYLGHFLRQLGSQRPAVISVDDYPFWHSTTPGSQYFLTLRTLRDSVRTRSGLAFWFVAQIGPDMCPPSEEALNPPITEAHIRFNVFSAIAYGAKGISYWLAAKPPGTNVSDKFTGGLIDGGGTRTKMYPTIQRISHELHKLGPWLMPLQSVAVYHVSASGFFGITDETSTSGTIISSVSGTGASNILAGQLRNSGAEDYLLMMNKDASSGASSLTVQVTLTATASAIYKIDKGTGSGSLLAQNSSSFSAASLAPGDGELYRIVW